jgi:hypothetical protein
MKTVHKAAAPGSNGFGIQIRKQPPGGDYHLSDEPFPFLFLVMATIFSAFAVVAVLFAAFFLQF